MSSIGHRVGEVTLTPVLDAVGLLATCDDAYPDVPIELWNPFRRAYPETRAALVDSVVDTDTLVVCAHYPGSGVGRVVRRDGRVLWEEAA